MLQKYRLTALLALLPLLAVPMVLAISSMENDDFEDGTTQNWGQGSPSGLVNNIADGGPGGAGDNFLEVESTGMGGPGTRLVVFNDSQWTGDFNAVGSEFTISMQLTNLGASALNIRVGLEGTDPLKEGIPTGRYVSTTAVTLPAADGAWQLASFNLSAADMTSVEGVLTLSEVLDNVVQMRIINAASTAWRGDDVAAIVGIDDIQVVSVPVELQSFSID